MYRALTRAAGARSQTSLTPAERRAKVRGAFYSTDRAARLVEGAHVVLVDVREHEALQAVVGPAVALD